MQQTWLTPFNIIQLYPKNELKLKVVEYVFNIRKPCASEHNI